MTNSGTALPPSSVNGQTWNLSATPARGQRSMYLTSPAGFTVVVTGNAGWAELRQLAASLRPIARPRSGYRDSVRCSGTVASAGGATSSGVCGVRAGVFASGLPVVEGHLDVLLGAPLVLQRLQGHAGPVGLGQRRLDDGPRPQPPGQHHVDLGASTR